MINAYRMLGDGTERPDYSVEMTTVFLPRIVCDVCRAVRLEWYVYHHSLKCSAKTLAAIRAAEDPASSWEQIEKLRKKIPRDNERLWDLPPGCQLGSNLPVPPGHQPGGSATSNLSRRVSSSRQVAPRRLVGKLPTRTGW